MEKTRSNPVIHLLPSMRDVAFFLPVLFLLKTKGASRMIEGDTGWHIRAGEWIIENGRVPDKDIFSFSKPGEPWFAWEWLWDVVFAWLHGWGGLAAVVLVSLFLTCTVALILYREVLRQSGNCLLAIGLTYLALAAGSIHWWARPHMFTLLFGLAAFILLERARTESMRRLWLLPPMVVLWTNLHAGFIVAVLMIAAYAAGELLTGLLAPEMEGRRQALTRSGKFAGIAAASLAASLVNPYHYQLHTHIYRYLTTEWHFQNVAEFFSVSFQTPAARYFEILLILSLAAAFWHLTRKRFTYVFLLVGWTHLALFAGRNIALFALVAAPLTGFAAREWAESLEKANVADWPKRLWRSFAGLASEIGVIESMRRMPLARMAGIAGVTLLYLSPGAPARFRAGFDETYPSKALPALAAYIQGRIFTTDEWGDYLIYSFYPRIKVFVDGRSDFYGESFDQKYVDIVGVKPGWREALATYGIDTVLLPVTTPMAGALKESRGWRVVYDDGVAIVFRASAADGIRTSVVSPGTSSLKGGSSKPDSSGGNVTNSNGRRDET
ncbi:MAG: hypothetical protein HY820_33175 [Acidobacteria bacterium]|nr:hypothetical protein [Acidobacteriota bacterium]